MKRRTFSHLVAFLALLVSPTSAGVRGVSGRRDSACERDSDCLRRYQYCQAGKCAKKRCDDPEDCASQHNIFKRSPDAAALRCQRAEGRRKSNPRFRQEPDDDCGEGEPAAEEIGEEEAAAREGAIAIKCAPKKPCDPPPCEVATCAEAATCENDECGACAAKFYDEAGTRVCRNGGIVEDKDSMASWSAVEGNEKKGEEESMQNVSCSKESDCPMGTYCSRGTCLANGRCRMESDCQNPFNRMKSETTCEGEFRCADSGFCEKECGCPRYKKDKFEAMLAADNCNDPCHRYQWKCPLSYICVRDECNPCVAVHYDETGRVLTECHTTASKIPRNPVMPPSRATKAPKRPKPKFPIPTEPPKPRFPTEPPMPKFPVPAEPPETRPPPCLTAVDCSFDEYCSVTTGSCQRDGRCEGDADCLDPDNAFGKGCFGSHVCNLETELCEERCLDEDSDMGMTSECPPDQPLAEGCPPCESDLCDGTVICRENFCGGCNYVFTTMPGVDICQDERIPPTQQQNNEGT